MDDMRLDPASNEPARQPEAVAASLIGQRDPADRAASTHRLVPPPLDQSQQCGRIRLQFLQRLALDARNSSAHQPARLAAATASGRWRPSGLGMYTRRLGSGRYAPRWT